MRFVFKSGYLENVFFMVDHVYIENDKNIETCMKFYHSYNDAMGSIPSAELLVCDRAHNVRK